jgi:hypothetical protein
MLFDLLTQTLGGNAVGQMSRQLGADEGTTSKAISTALPMLLGALTRNASAGSGAESLTRALTKDHDGSILGDLSGFLGDASAGSGAGILRHVLGGRRQTVESAVSRSSGLDLASVGKLMTMLAPVVMGALGQVRQQQGLDARGVSSLLQGEMKQAQRQGNVDLGLLSLLDADGDGSVVDDVAKLGGGILGKLFGK